MDIYTSAAMAGQERQRGRLGVIELVRQGLCSVFSSDEIKHTESMVEGTTKTEQHATVQVHVVGPGGIKQHMPTQKSRYRNRSIMLLNMWYLLRVGIYTSNQKKQNAFPSSLPPNNKSHAWYNARPTRDTSLPPSPSRCPICCKRKDCVPSMLPIIRNPQLRAQIYR